MNSIGPTTKPSREEIKELLPVERLGEGVGLGDGLGEGLGDGLDF